MPLPPPSLEPVPAPAGPSAAVFSGDQVELAPWPTTPDRRSAVQRPAPVGPQLEVASVYLGDLPYLVLTSGERVYPGSVVQGGAKLEAIGPRALIFSTPDGLVKVPSHFPHLRQFSEAEFIPKEALVLPTVEEALSADPEDGFVESLLPVP